MDSSSSSPPVLQQTPESSVSKKSASPLLIGLGVLLCSILAGVGGYYVGLNQVSSDPSGGVQVTAPPTTTPVGVACTLDAKLCPDGSSVGRVGPTCEFAACPTGSSNFEISLSGKAVGAEAAASIREMAAAYLQQQGLTAASLLAEQRTVNIEVSKANAEWFLGMGVVTGSKNCVVASGGTDCGGPGPTFLMLGHRVNGVWEVAVEYTPKFTQLAKEAPESIMSADQKKYTLPSE